MLNFSKGTFMLKVCWFLCVSAGIFKVHLFPLVFRKTNKNARVLDMTAVSEHKKKCFDSDKVPGKPDLNHSYSCGLDLDVFP